MGVSFILGRMCSNKLDTLFDLCFEEAKIESRDPIFILVPEKNSYEIEKKFSERLMVDKDPFFRIRVVTFSSLSNIVFSNTGGLVEKKLSQSARNMLIYKALDSISSDLVTIKANSSGVGFVSRLLDLIIEFKQNNMSCEDVVNMANLVDDDELKYRLLDYAKVYKRYEELIMDNYLDVEDNLGLFSSKLDDFSGIKNATVFITEFTGFTPVQYNVIEKVLLYSKNTYVSLTTDLVNFNSRSGVFSKTNITFLKINEICQKYGIKRNKDTMLYCDGYYSSGELSFLEKNINKYKIVPFEGDNKAVRVIQFLNSYDEIRFVADEITRLVRDLGYKYNEITVASRNLDAYSFIMKVMFEDYNIRYFLDEKLSAKDNPLIVLVVSILQMKSKNYSYESVFKYLKTGLSNLSYVEVSKLENYVLANGIKGKMWFESEWSYPISHSLEDEDEVDLTEINMIREKLMSPIISLSEKLKGRNRVYEICKYLYEFMIDIELDTRFASIIDEFENKDNLYKSSEYSQVWNICMSVFDEMYEFIGDESIALDRFIKLMESEFEGFEIGIVPPSRDQVSLTSIDRMNNSETKVLFILGMGDGIFPASISDDSMISENDRDKLLKIGVKFDSSVMTRAYDEEYLVYKAFSSAREKIYASYSSSNFDGKTILPSPIIKKLKMMFSDLKVESFENYEDVAFEYSLSSKESLFSRLETKIKSKDIKDKGTWRSVYEYFKNSSEFLNRIKMIDRGLNYSNSVSNLTRSISEDIYGNGIFSVSKLESYVSCPFSYFLNYGLRLRKKERYEFSAMDSGLYSHKILDEFSKSMVYNGVSWKDIDRTFIEREVRKISSRLFLSKKSYILNSSKRYSYLANRINNALVESIDIMAEQIRRGDFIPSGFEVEFGGMNGLNPIRYKLSSGKEVMLIGKIDRVDLCNDKDTDYIRLIDYKSSTKDLNMSKIYEGIQMQLFIYMRALLNSKKRIDIINQDNLFIEEDSKKVTYKPAALLYSRFNLKDSSLDGVADLINTDEEEIREGVLNENKLNGLVIAEDEVIKHLDKTISSVKKSSKILPIVLKSNGEPSSYTKGIDYHDFNTINDYVFEKAKDICECIYSGNIDIFPYKYDYEEACRFCEYKSICQFDMSTGKNRFNKLQKVTRDYGMDNILAKMKDVLLRKKGIGQTEEKKNNVEVKNSVEVKNNVEVLKNNKVKKVLEVEDSVSCKNVKSKVGESDVD